MKLKRLIATLTVMLLALSTTTASAIVHGPGSFYTQFSGDGAVLIPIPPGYASEKGLGGDAVVADSKNRILLGVGDESSENIYIQRILPSGEIDQSFDSSRIECPGSVVASQVRDLQLDSFDNVYAVIDCDGGSSHQVVRLRAQDGEFDGQFGLGGFLNLADELDAKSSIINGIAVDSSNRVYILGQVTNLDDSFLNGIWRFSGTGSKLYFPAPLNSNEVILGENDDLLMLGEERSGTILYDANLNKIVVTGQTMVETNVTVNGQRHKVSDIWATTLDTSTGILNWNDNEQIWTTGLRPSDSTSEWDLHNFRVYDVTVDGEGWLTLVGEDFHAEGQNYSFGIQVRLGGQQHYFYEFQEPAVGSNYCSAYTVFSDPSNGFYVAGTCNEKNFVQHYLEDTSRDLSFQVSTQNGTPYRDGIFFPQDFVDLDESLLLAGNFMSNSPPSYNNVGLIKYRIKPFDDEPVIQPTTPAGEPTTPAGEPTNPAGGSGTPALTPAAPTAPTAPAAKALPTLGVKKKLAGKSLATQIGMTVTPKAKVKLKVAKVSRKICKVSGGKLVALKPGNCSVTVSVTPKKTKQVKKPKTTKQSTVVVIS